LPASSLADVQLMTEIGVCWRRSRQAGGWAYLKRRAGRRPL